MYVILNVIILLEPIYEHDFYDYSFLDSVHIEVITKLFKRYGMRCLWESRGAILGATPFWGIGQTRLTFMLRDLIAYEEQCPLLTRLGYRVQYLLSFELECQSAFKTLTCSLKIR